MKEQLYCVAAESRETRHREDITGPMSRDAAETEKARINATRSWRLTHRYFHVAKYPYRGKTKGAP